MIQKAYKRTDLDELLTDMRTLTPPPKLFEYKYDCFSLTIFHHIKQGYYSLELTDKRYIPYNPVVILVDGEMIEIMNAKTLEEIMAELPQIVAELTVLPPKELYDVNDGERFYFVSQN